MSSLSDTPNLGSRIVIVGNTGSGKTSLAKSLSAALNLPRVELDNLFWGPNWTEAEPEDFRSKVSDVLSNADAWIVDGNYSCTRDIVWGGAVTLIWLDYPFRTSFWRLVKRTFRLWITKESLWDSQNKQGLARQFFSKDSIFLWSIKSHPKKKRKFPVLLQQPEYSHLRVIRLRSPKETEAFLSSLHKDTA